MSKFTLGNTIRRELDRLNVAIDIKIIKGVSYRREAERHKFLSAQLRSISKRSEKSWFAKSWIGSAARFVSSFVL